MKVKVTAKAFYDSQLRYPGETLLVDDDFKASWATSIEEPKPAAKNQHKKTSNKKKADAVTKTGSGRSGAARKGSAT